MVADCTKIISRLNYEKNDFGGNILERAVLILDCLFSENAYTQQIKIIITYAILEMGPQELLYHL